LVLQLDLLEKNGPSRQGRILSSSGRRFTDEGLVLGAGTNLAEVTRHESGALALDGDEARILALLSVAYSRSFRASLVGTLRKASGAWHRGDRSLAYVHLSLAGLRPLADHEEAFRLFAADHLLEAGVRREI
jgi:hypothetical protein